MLLKRRSLDSTAARRWVLEWRPSWLRRALQGSNLEARVTTTATGLAAGELSAGNDALISLLCALAERSIR